MEHQHTIRQYILVNTDLGMTKGKVAASVAHASMKIFFDMMEKFKTYKGEETGIYMIRVDETTQKWINGSFAKIILKVSEKEISDGRVLAEKFGVPLAVINDNGATQVEPGSLTAVAIGPVDIEDETNSELIEWLSKWRLY